MQQSNLSDPADVMACYREIERELTTAGAPFETVPVDVAGDTVRSYRRAAPDFYTAVAEFGDRFGDHVLVTDETGSRTYHEILDRAGRLAAALRDRYGIGPGDRVGIMMANRAEYPVTLFAVARLGAVAVLYNSRSSATEIADAIADVPSAVVVADPKRVEILRAVAAPARLVCTDPAGPEDVPAVDELLADGGDPGAHRPADPDSICLVLFTSGTSGRAKGVALTHRNIGNVVLNMKFVSECNIRFASRQYGIEVDDLRSFMPAMSPLLVFPLFHVSGLAGLLIGMSTGGRIVTMARWDPAHAAELVERYRLTLAAGPPMAVDELLAQPDAAQRLSSLVNLAPGGQANPPNVSRRIATVLPAAQRSVGWGMTETGGSVCTAGGVLLAAFPDTLGPMSPTMDVRVVDAAGIPVPAGEIGELELHGGLVAAEYLGPGADSAVFHDHWLRTGDLGYLDEYELVYIVDRSKDIIIAAGENISCLEVESVLAATDEFAEVAVFGVPDRRLGERVVAAVTLRAGVSRTAAEIVESARRSLPAYKLPTEIRFDLSPLPRNATGKLLKRELRARYLARDTAS
ncbi:class I adenylate-forming enzyme family protein [Nocardia aurantia]|uniref:Long-chain-fatty-acid--CoA ligase FadD13 n=1 Tax=Nocardia aurantia TaxID=2585199 RepID=A0A7K0DVC5_9NOCA|nr:class I adenylate-forming enzyme family protein [Nocardia aurantia]MQY28784.1 Long-chain-fatty-acid--CoA ligase FadD13 [Nocardia aurantia]